MGLGIRPYQRGLHDLGNGVFAWLQPDGGWGWSNAGLICDHEESLLVDTLFDVPLTAAMLAAMRDAAPAAKEIRTLVNTHANGDHCNGNGCCPHADIIASEAAALEMTHETPEMMLGFLKAAPTLGDMGAFFQQCFGKFDFASATSRRLPTTTFSGRMTRQVGDRLVELVQVGPAHTAGDVLVHVPSDRTVFTGDVLFIEGHPIMWAGPVAAWIAACDYILALDVETVVPGHGPVTGKNGVRAVRDYLGYIRDEARKRFDAGLTAADAARDINMSDYDSWGDGERIAVNVATLYREFAGSKEPGNPAELFALMAQLSKERRR